MNNSGRADRFYFKNSSVSRLDKYGVDLFK